MGKGKTRENKSRRTITRPCVILAVVIVAVVSMLALVSCAHDGYKLVFNVDGQVTTSLEVKDKEEVVLPDPAAKDGYTFAGWYFDKDTFTDPCTAATLKDKKLKGENTIYAKWTKNDYTIKYEPNGGVNAKGNPSGYAIDTPTIKLAAPTKLGYTFGGWFGKADFTDKAITEIAKGSTGNKTFYAKWNINSYTITYDTNGGGTITDTTYDILAMPSSFAAPAAKLGYTFAAWYDNAAFEGSPITAITLENIGNKTLFAKWTAIEYSITYNLNDGVLTGTYPTTYTTDKDTTLAMPTKVGYTFEGWYEQADFSDTSIIEIAIGSTGNKTLFAKWTKDNYTITYNLNGGMEGTANPTTYAVDTATFTLNAPTHANNWMTFGGWYGQADFKDTAITEIATGSTGNKTFYAKWIFTGTPGLTYTKTTDNLAYEVSSSTVTGAIYIPSKHEEAGETLPVNIAENAFKTNRGITSVVIDEGVTSMGSTAFWDCTSLTSVTIPASITSIGFGIFYKCPLTSVTIPDGVTSIGNYTFSDCSKLASVTIPDSVKLIGANAFENCSALTSVVVPNGVNKIRDETFKGCTSLTSVNIPNSVTNISRNAFNGCTALTSIFIPSSVTTMGNSVFQGCTTLTIYCERASSPLPSTWDAQWMGDVPTSKIKWEQTKPVTTP